MLLFAVAITATVLLAASAAHATDIQDLIREIKARYARHSSSTPVISNVTYQKEPVGAYHKFEIGFDLDATYDNPFDPDDIDVEGHFVSPNGRELIIPGFFYDGYEPVNNKTTNTYLSTYYNKLDESGWKIRFSSGATGKYKFFITAKDSKGNVFKTESHSFSIAPSGSNGYVQVSTTNPSYFEHSADGSLFYGSGTNLHAVIGSEKDPARQNFEYYFDKIRNNASSTRIWICHWRWLEWTPDPDQPKSHTYGGLNFYNQAMSANLDRIFSMAEKIDLRIQLTLDDNEEQVTCEKYNCWDFNPYNIRNGGPAASAKAYWSSKEVREIYKKKLRYITARWGYSTSMWSLNQWNDMSNPTADQVSYSKELRDYTHTLFDGWRPIIFGSNFGHESDRYMDYAMFGKSMVTGKPRVTQESYYTTNQKWFGSVLREQQWEGLLQGNAVRMVWPHWMVDRTDSWPVFRSILNFVSDVPLNKKQWSPLDVHTITSQHSIGETFSRVIEVKGYGDIPSSGVKARENKFVITSDKSSQFLEGFAAGAGWQGHMLYGTSHADLRNPPTFVIDVPESGSMLVRVKLVGPGGHRLVSVVNGKKGPSKSWQYTERTEVREKGKAEEYLSIPLSKGRNEITLDCDGPEYIRLGWLYFILDTRDPNGTLAVNGMISDQGDDAIVYVMNQTYTELYHTILGREPAAVRSTQLEMKGFKKGRYNVVFYDPVQGDYAESFAVESVDGRIVIPIDRIENDLAIKVRSVSLPIKTEL